MRKMPFVMGEYYHLYNRGVDKRVVYSNASEYRRFLAYLYMLNNRDVVDPSNFFRSHNIAEAFQLERGQPLVALGAFCLMPNHFHLYITPLVEGGISKFMQRVQTAYTKYFNEKHNRTGALFGGTFKAEHVKNNNHAKYLFSYIHLNPAKLRDPQWKSRSARNWKSLQSYVAQYPYSSYREYYLQEHLISDPRSFPVFFKNKREVVNHITDWLQTEGS